MVDEMVCGTRVGFTDLIRYSEAYYVIYLQYRWYFSAEWVSGTRIYLDIIFINIRKETVPKIQGTEF